MKKIDKDKLCKLYIDNKLSASKIAIIFDCSVSTILSRMNKYNIIKRSMSETVKLIGINGRKHPNYIDGRTTIKYYCIDCGSKISYQTAIYGKNRCFGCSSIDRSRSGVVTGKNSPTYKNGKPKCIDCGKQLNYYTNKRCRYCYRKNLSLMRRGRGNPMFGIPTPKIKRVYYKNMYMRSTWEANFAKWLDLSGIKWEYESKTFDLGDTTYTPDFYLPEFGIWIEIKGWWREASKKKFIVFRRLYQNIDIRVFNRSSLINLGLINS